ncbi:MAG: SocA family protein [Prevotella sp.]|nr:SocA family protein [Prevotella sp.]
MAHTKLFKQDVAIQAILFIVQQMGGKCDIHKCHKILYFADNEHLAKWGRSITGDSYVKMDFGPVPTCIYDLIKAVRGDSYFASQVDDIRKNLFHIENNKDIVATSKPDMDYLSETDVEILEKYIQQLEPLDFNEVTRTSHGYAWTNAQQNGEISIHDRLKEMGESEDYIHFVEEQLEAEEVFA